MEKTLDAYPAKACVRITGLNADTPLFSRLRELGWTENAFARIYMRAPLNDPVAVDIKGSVFAVRVKDLKNITAVSEDLKKCP